MENSLKLFYLKNCPYCKKACVVCISNPIDVLTYLIPQYADMDPARVMGTGTLLDSARLKRFIADLFDVAPRSIEAVALGEHGFTAAVMWNSTISSLAILLIRISLKISPLTRNPVRKSLSSVPQVVVKLQWSTC